MVGLGSGLELGLGLWLGLGFEVGLELGFRVRLQVEQELGPGLYSACHEPHALYPAYTLMSRAGTTVIRRAIGASSHSPG